VRCSTFALCYLSHSLCCKKRPSKLWNGFFKEGHEAARPWYVFRTIFLKELCSSSTADLANIMFAVIPYVEVRTPYDQRCLILFSGYFRVMRIRRSRYCFVIYLIPTIRIPSTGYVANGLIASEREGRGRHYWVSPKLEALFRSSLYQYRTFTSTMPMYDPPFLQNNHWCWTEVVQSESQRLLALQRRGDLLGGKIHMLHEDATGRSHCGYLDMF
jgi:hypothetical protein